MTCINAKCYLLQYRRALERIHQLEARIERLYAEAEVQAAAPKPDIVRGSGKKQDRTADLAVKIADISDRLWHQQMDAIDLAEEVATVIEAVPDPVQSRLLYDRYIDGMSWDEVANDIGYDPVHTRGRLHGAALIEVQRIIGV